MESSCVSVKISSESNESNLIDSSNCPLTQAIQYVCLYFSMVLHIFCLVFFIVLFRCGHYERALEAFQKCGNWRQVFCLATGKLGFSTEQILRLARSVSGVEYICYAPPPNKQHLVLRAAMSNKLRILLL